MTVTPRQIATHAASAGAGAVVAIVILISLQSAFPPGGPPSHQRCPSGSEFRTFASGPYSGWKACLRFLPGGSDFSLWNVTAVYDSRNGSVIAFVYHYNVDIPYEAFLHQNTSYIESHQPVVYWNNTQASTRPGFAGETVQFGLFIPSLLFFGDELTDVKEVRFYLARHEPPIYDPSNEPHQIASDVLSITFVSPVQQ